MARFQCGAPLDINRCLSKRVRELVWRDALDYCRKHPDFRGKVVTSVHCHGTLKVRVFWEDPGEEVNDIPG